MTFIVRRKGGAPINVLLASAIVILYPILMMVYAFVGGEGLKLAIVVIGAVVFFIMYFRQTRMRPNTKKMMFVFMVLLLLLGWYGAFWTQLRSYGVMLVFVSSMGVAWAGLEFGLTKYVYEYPCYIFILITVGLVATGTDQYAFNSVLAVGSRNVYSAVLLAFAMGYLFSRFYRDKKASIGLCVLVVILSFSLYSRTGLAISIVLLFSSLVNGGSRSYVKVLIGVALLVFGVFSVINYEYIVSYVSGNSNFEKGVESSRFLLWKSYVHGIDGFGFLFGYPVVENEYIAMYGGNAHSAYIRMHSYFGLGMFLLLGLALISIKRLLVKRLWVYLVLLVCYFFRAAFDPVYFVGVFDYIFFPLVFYIVFHSYFSSQGKNVSCQ